jgi:hypothetical protein
MSRKLIESLAKFWLIWIWGYLILGGIANMNRGTSFLAAPVDAALPVWFKLLFLNVPLQIALALTASYLLARNTDNPPGFITVAVSVVATVLIIVNLATALWLMF